MYRAIEMKNERKMNLHIFLPSWHITMLRYKRHGGKSRSSEGASVSMCVCAWMFVDGWIYFLIRKRNELVCA